MMDEAMFIFQYKKHKVHDPDKRLMWLLVLVFDLTGKTKSLVKKNSINQISSTIGKSHGFICTKSYDANTANYLSNYS